MKKVISVIVAIVFAIVFVATLDSCTSAKNVPYFQNIEEVSLAASKGLYDAKIMPKDQFTITVSASDPMAASSFNLVVSGGTPNTGAAQTTMSSQHRLMSYLVDNDGCINYPHLGKIKVVGMTRTQLQDYIAAQIAPYFSAEEHPIVTVEMSNYRVTVMGEVASPKVVTVNSEKMSVLEAIASAGDLTIYGKRDNVLLIREDATGMKSTYTLNLNDANIINSPYYYVQQNDVIYVTPNKTKAKNSDISQATSLWFSATSILISVASLLYNILK